jgi:hypothetical protein
LRPLAITIKVFFIVLTIQHWQQHIDYHPIVGLVKPVVRGDFKKKL